MSNDFKQTFDAIKQEQADLNRRMQQAKREAIAHVQEIITAFGITEDQLKFGVVPTPVRKRTPAVIKYRTPTGITWTGKGRIKKEFSEYLHSKGETLNDLEKYRVNPPVKEEPKEAPKVEEPKEEVKTGQKEEKNKTRPLFHKPAK